MYLCYGLGSLSVSQLFPINNQWVNILMQNYYLKAILIISNRQSDKISLQDKYDGQGKNGFHLSNHENV